MQKNRIEISVKHKILLAKEFDTSRTTVQMSLDFYNNSEKAEKIRARTKELLLEQISKIDNYQLEQTED